MKNKGTKKNAGDKKKNKDKKEKRKRKVHKSFSNKSKSGKNKKKEKIEVTKDFKNNENKEVGEKEEEGYCLSGCKYGRKSMQMPMIQCDKCLHWFHCKCINFTVEDFKNYSIKNKSWHCPNC